MIIMSDDRRQHHQQLLLMDVVLEVDEDVFVVDVLNVGNKADIMDVSSLEAVVASPATDITSSSDCDHRDQGRDETTKPVGSNGGRGHNRLSPTWLWSHHNWNRYR
mmetsp:Transcript_36288/g.40502  ORF Transcript_36288/g.40502 Transcript_36288/m.40502 type:complete len:106 (+) Transcript_36288:20-337(+)